MITSVFQDKEGDFELYFSEVGLFHFFEPNEIINLKLILKLLKKSLNICLKLNI